MPVLSLFSLFFFFNDTATTEIYTLSLHDALPISPPSGGTVRPESMEAWAGTCLKDESVCHIWLPRSEEHTSELQSLAYLVCRLLLEKKKGDCESVLGPHRSVPAYSARH